MWIRQVKHALILSALFVSCTRGIPQDNNNPVLYRDTGYQFPYRLDEPARSWELPGKLIEISGIGFVDESTLACVQDENGTIFLFDVAEGKIREEVNFGNNGDYEGIEVIGKDAWILKSNGTLYRVKDYLDAGQLKVKKFETALARKNNTEGLGYDPFDNCLLIACKGQPFIGDNPGKDRKAVYRFSLETKQLEPEPFLLINLDTVQKYQDYDAMTRLGIEISSYFDKSEGDGTFQPSGIAVHPLTGEIYLLGSVGKLLLVLTREGMLLCIVRLDPGVFRQPEGICFSPEGTLYISSEGKGRAGKILEFNAE